MKDRTVKQLHAVIRKFTLKWKTALFLGMWKIDWSIKDWLISETKDFQCIARCETDWRYFEATLSFNFLKMKDMSEEEIEKTVIHELLHVVLNEMREGGAEHEERVASHFTMIMNWLNGEAKDGKD